MIRNSQLIIRPAKFVDQHRLVNLIHFETHVHRHLDWLAPLEWLDQPPFLVAEQDGRLGGVLSCPEEPPGVAWVRLFGIASEKDPVSMWHALWPQALSALRQGNRPRIAVLPLQEWFADLLLNEGFVQTTRVVFLMWANTPEPPDIKESTVRIRSMEHEDLPYVADVDTQAFGPLWRNSEISLHAALNQSAIATVAEDQDGIVGYQISTSSPLGGHLARLAVLPHRQGQHIGSALMSNLLHQFRLSGISRVSVNTQENNPTSIYLYQRFGFRLTEEAYPVLEYSD